MKTAIATALLMLSTVSVTLANEPVLTITEPTGIVYVSSFPYNTAIKFSISHGPSTSSPSTNNELKNINVLKMSVNGDAVLDIVGNPFDGSNQCTSMPSGVICSAVDANNATITVPFSVPAPGDYTILVSVKHQGETGVDEETVSFLLLSVEYPAPPAIANKYINSTPQLKSGAAKVRGCVITQIAGLHAHESKYGPKGGPYNDALVKSDVNLFWPGCK